MSNYNKEKIESGMLIAKIKDKYEICLNRNKITFTDFMQLAEKSAVKKYINQNHITNCFWHGGVDSADREILIFYPEKINRELAEKSINSFLSCVHIELQTDIVMEHREYLSGIMKLGIVREKFGDIIVNGNSADIIAFKDTANYFVNNLPLLTRFKKARIELIDIFSLEKKEEKFEEIVILVSSIRLDNVVAELCHCSRNQAQEIIIEQRVFINGISEMKESKKLSNTDVITIRGKGKFIFDSIIGNTKSGRYKILIKKYKM